MSTATVTLTKGWKVGDTVHTVVELGELTAGDIIDAGTAAERVVFAPGAGWVLVQSPTLAGIEMLARQIRRIGDLADLPVTIDMLRKLDPDDLEDLQDAAAGLSQARVKTTEARGRGDPGGA